MGEATEGKKGEKGEKSGWKTVARRSLYFGVWCVVSVSPGFTALKAHQSV